MMTDQKNIQALREKIDKIDDTIIRLVDQRLVVAKEIGEIKRRQGEKLWDGARESTLIKRLFTLDTALLSHTAISHIFMEIIAACREIQQPPRITYLGPEATFTHIAAMKHFGHSAIFVPCSSIRDVFQDVEKGACHYGTVPVENSIEGAVNYTLDLFYEADLKICAEIYLTVSHDLLSESGLLEDIKVIYSHPHAFAQCRRWLQKYLPQAPLEECSSTAEAAVKASKIPGAAAIANREAGHLYHLQVAAPGIEDISRNITRFLVIGREETRQTGQDKTSVMFVTPHVPGALHHVLEPLAKAGINMVKLESRPIKYENWSYCFFVDLEGHLEDPVMKQTLEKMKGLCPLLKYLGSYPKANEEY
ncbi:MAG: prephenate dehydratase [Desulfobacterales bacterium]|nr:prephenate dehydratase [Desulfobacterales bacterium]